MIQVHLFRSYKRARLVKGHGGPVTPINLLSFRYSTWQDECAWGKEGAEGGGCNYAIDAHLTPIILKNRPSGSMA
jgi:hypothetical protein